MRPDGKYYVWLFVHRVLFLEGFQTSLCVVVSVTLPYIFCLRYFITLPRKICLLPVFRLKFLPIKPFSTSQELQQASVTPHTPKIRHVDQPQSYCTTKKANAAHPSLKILCLIVTERQRMHSPAAPSAGGQAHLFSGCQELCP